MSADGARAADAVLEEVAELADHRLVGRQVKVVDAEAGQLGLPGGGVDPRAAAATEDPEPAAPSAFPAGKMTPWQQYAQALLGSGEFLYVD